MLLCVYWMNFAWKFHMNRENKYDSQYGTLFCWHNFLNHLKVITSHKKFNLHIMNLKNWKSYSLSYVFQISTDSPFSFFFPELKLLFWDVTLSFSSTPFTIFWFLVQIHFSKKGNIYNLILMVGSKFEAI